MRYWGYEHCRRLKLTVGAINKCHQAYYTEKTEFTSDISTLGVGIETSTQNYKYTVPNTEEQLATEGLTKRNTKFTDTLNSYIGMVFLVDTGIFSTFRTIPCETTASGSGSLTRTYTACSQGGISNVASC